MIGWNSTPSDLFGHGRSFCSLNLLNIARVAQLPEFFLTMLREKALGPFVL